MVWGCALKGLEYVGMYYSSVEAWLASAWFLGWFGCFR